MNVVSACEYILDRLRQNLDPVYTYHNIDHTLNVCEAVRTLCLQEKIAEPEATLLNTAAAYHDAGFLLDHVNHELHSCAIVRKILPDFNFSEEHIEFVCSMIMSTAHGHVPKSIFEKIIRDADVDYLGTENYERYSEALRRELISTGKIGAGEEEWKQLQISYLSHHQYYTATSIQLREPNKQKTLTLLLKSV